MGSIIVPVVMLNVGGRAEEAITCEAGHFALGQNGSVTCNFHRNLRESMHHVYVAHYPFQAPDEFSGNDILRCSGLSLPSPMCTVADGYLLEGKIGHRLTLTIPELKKEFAGRYACQTVPPDGKQVDLCNLTVQETIMTETTPVSTTYCPDVDVKSERMIFIPIITILCVVIAVLVSVVCKQRTSSSHSNRMGPEARVDAPMLDETRKETQDVLTQIGKPQESFCNQALETG